MNPTWPRIAFNAAAYQTGWFAAVLGAASGWPWLGASGALPLLAIHSAFDPALRRELPRIGTVTAVGFAVDSASGAAAVLEYRTGWPLAWLCPAG